MGLPWRLRGEESARSAGDTRDERSIPESVRPLEEGMVTHSSILA